MDSPYLIIGIPRIILSTDKNGNLISSYYHNRITPDKTITLGSGKILNFTSVIIYQGSGRTGHYWCYFKCNEQWYHYNDIGGQLNKIDDVYKIDEVYTQGSLYFYT